MSEPQPSGMIRVPSIREAALRDLTAGLNDRGMLTPAQTAEEWLCVIEAEAYKAGRDGLDAVEDALYNLPHGARCRWNPDEGGCDCSKVAGFAALDSLRELLATPSDTPKEPHP